MLFQLDGGEGIAKQWTIQDDEAMPMLRKGQLDGLSKEMSSHGAGSSTRCSDWQQTERSFRHSSCSTQFLQRYPRQRRDICYMIVAASIAPPFDSDRCGKSADGACGIYQRTPNTVISAILVHGLPFTSEWATKRTRLPSLPGNVTSCSALPRENVPVVTACPHSWPSALT